MNRASTVLRRVTEQNHEEVGATLFLTPGGEEQQRFILSTLLGEYTSFGQQFRKFKYLPIRADDGDNASLALWILSDQMPHPHVQKSVRAMVRRLFGHVHHQVVFTHSESKFENADRVVYGREFGTHGRPLDRGMTVHI